MVALASTSIAALPLQVIIGRLLCTEEAVLKDGAGRPRPVSQWESWLCGSVDNLPLFTGATWL